MALCHKDFLFCNVCRLSANTCLARTVRKSLVRAGPEDTFSYRASYVCTVAVKVPCSMGQWVNSVSLSQRAGQNVLREFSVDLRQYG